MRVRRTRAWKLFLLLPRMLLHKPPRGGLVAQKKLEERFAAFAAGRWAELFRASREADVQASAQTVRRRRREFTDALSRRAQRAVSFVQMGELSAARQALEGAQLAPATLATLAALTNPDRRPSAPRESLGRGIEEHVPVERFELDKELFLINLRTARRGAGAGPSGMTSDHLFPLLESERDSVMFAEFAQSLAVADVLHQVLRILGLGRLIALTKPDGGVRGIVVGDLLRRLVGRTMAKQVTKEVEAATSPFQYALSTRSGCECVAHVLQTLTELDEDATIVSVDGIGAYDLISRKAMLDGLLSVERREQLLPFATQTEPCRDPNFCPSLQHPLCPCLQTDFQSWTHSRSGCSSDAAFVFPFLCLRDPAGVAANSTHLATTARDVQKQEFWGDVVSLWKGQQHKCAVKPEEGFLPMCWSETWTCQCSTSSTAAGWKWWRTDSLCGTDRSWRLTQHWSLHCTVMEQPDGGRSLQIETACSHGFPPMGQHSRDEEYHHTRETPVQKCALYFAQYLYRPAQAAIASNVSPLKPAL